MTFSHLYRAIVIQRASPAFVRRSCRPITGLTEARVIGACGERSGARARDVGERPSAAAAYLPATKRCRLAAPRIGAACPVHAPATRAVFGGAHSAELMRVGGIRVTWAYRAGPSVGRRSCSDDALAAAGIGGLLTHQRRQAFQVSAPVTPLHHVRGCVRYASVPGLDSDCSW